MNRYKIFESFTKSREKNNAGPQRKLQFENLEERCVLSANGFDLAPAVASDTVLTAPEAIPSQPLGSSLEQAQTDITSITVSVNGELRTLNPANDRLQLAAGDEFEVVEISFDSNATQGVFAVEGYLNKLQDDSSTSLIDYNDGRFSLIEDNFAANGSNGVVGGLDESWTAEFGWDRLTLSLLHYQDSNTSIVSRAIIDLQVGQADFAFDPAALQEIQNLTGTVGESFDVFGIWKNLGEGKFHNYAELDVYHLSDREQIVWAGAIVGNASADNPVEGLFVNTRRDDTFPETFVPDRPGTYVFRFYLDPEGIVSETNESNNQIDIEITIEEPNSTPVANNDRVSATVNQTLDQIDVLVNDLDAEQDALQVNEFTQPKNGEVTVNDDGTFSFTPEEGFVGTDEFTYSISDGNSDSNFATVEVEVDLKFKVANQAAGDEDTAIALQIDADPKQVTHVQISNVPDAATLSQGELVEAGTYEVSVEDLANLTVTPETNSDASFDLKVTAFNGHTEFLNSAQTIEVSVNAVADGGNLNVLNFGIVTGTSGSLPYKFGFADLDGSEQHTVTLNGLPDFVSLSAGERVGRAWVLDLADLEDLQIRADVVKDTSGFTRSFGFSVMRYEVNVAFTSTELSNRDQVTGTDRFTFIAIQRESVS